jgi:DnaK suppressor protein
MKNELQKESLKQLLLAQKVQLLDKMAQERGGKNSRAEAAAELAPAEQSHAQNITERDTAFALQEHDIEELEATELALMRITQGTYGQCLGCETEIPITRLNWHFLRPGVALTMRVKHCRGLKKQQVPMRLCIDHPTDAQAMSIL